jgi:phosphatidylglycerophosphate synthase
MTSVQRWSALHHGIVPARVPLLLPWLRLMWWLARPLRRVPPTVITALGLLLAGGAVVLAGSRPAVAAGVVVLAAVCDGLDGAVAVLTDRATAFGARADAIADRLTDVAFAAVLWRCGAPWELAVGCGVLAVAVDVLRRLRRTPSRITAGERPTWTVCAALAGGSAAVTSADWPVLVCGSVWVAAGVVALGQIARPFQLGRPARRSRQDDAVR